MSRKSGYRAIHLEFPSLHYDVLAALVKMIKERLLGMEALESGDIISVVARELTVAVATAVADIAKVDDEDKFASRGLKIASFRLLAKLAGSESKEAIASKTEFERLLVGLLAGKKNPNEKVPATALTPKEPDQAA